MKLLAIATAKIAGHGVWRLRQLSWTVRFLRCLE
jgi:hypothetical protein